MNTKPSTPQASLNPQPARRGPVPLDLTQLRQVVGGVKAVAELQAPRGKW
ncbi:MAG TPA: hypothetical protein VIW70_16470 [Rubrivivax sp.]